MAQKGIPTTVLVAPDSFKGTLSASDVAAAIARGIDAAGRPVDLCPVADGGEGTLAVLAPALELRTLTATVSDPLGRPVEATFGLTAPDRPGGVDRASRLRRGGESIAVIETAAASGLGRVGEDERDAFAASTAGTGELIAAAIAAGADTIFLGVGGSATTDGGAGAVTAISAAGGLRGVKLTVLCDVRTPFQDAARVFAPQKGASTEDVRRLTARLTALARRLARDPRGLPMTGAAGGLAGGLWAALEAELVPGASFVLDAVDFDARMRAARAVVTGEGRLDRQSLAGKAVSEVATRSRQAGVPCHAIVGSSRLGSFGARVLDLGIVLEAGTEHQLEQAGRRLSDLL